MIAGLLPLARRAPGPVWPSALLRASLFASLAAIAVLLLPAAAHADEDSALALLERMRNAATASNYQGTMVFSAGGSISSSRVWHYCVGEQTYERLEAQDGRQQRVLRHNDEVRTYWPQSRLAVIESREPLAGWSGRSQALDERALDSYTLRAEGQARVAGRDAMVVVLEPRDALRYAQRLWADRASGLMLRADVLGPDHRVLETAAFSEIEIGVRPDPQSVLRAMGGIDDAPRSPARGVSRMVAAPAAARAGMPRGQRAEAVTGTNEAWRVLRPPQRRTGLEAEGWALKSDVPGFRLVSCVMRDLESASRAGPVARPAPGGGSGKVAEPHSLESVGEEEIPVLQAVFSDGLTHVSLFVEPYRPQRHRGTVQTQLGATSTVTRRQGEHWITVVGDAPPATLVQFADVLEPRR